VCIFVYLAISDYWPYCTVLYCCNCLAKPARRHSMSTVNLSLSPQCFLRLTGFFYCWLTKSSLCVVSRHLAKQLRQWLNYLLCLPNWPTKRPNCSFVFCSNFSNFYVLPVLLPWKLKSAQNKSRWLHSTEIPALCNWVSWGGISLWS
jgi:hypothetical protein